MKSEFRNDLGESVFYNKYAHDPQDTWAALAVRLVDDVCGTLQGTAKPLIGTSDREQLIEYIQKFKFIPGGRYLYYAGRPAHFWNNCFLLRAEEDTREEWAELVKRVTSCLMSGGGIGVDYSVLRPEGAPLASTGGKASGPIPLMYMVNEIGRNVMQGGSRRSAIYASLDWQHADAGKFLVAKNWDEQKLGNTDFTHWDAKMGDFNHAAPLDTYLKNVEQALRTGEPGFSFNFGEKSRETLRNACTEVTSEDDSDVCNLGSINMANVETLEEFRDIARLASVFLACGTLRADLPYKKVARVREKNRRLGLGLMGMHEWLLKRGYGYEVTPEMHQWLAAYKEESERGANWFCDWKGISRPVAYRAIAPTGSIGILAGTTTGIEPVFAVAYKRRYLKDGTRWHYKYVIDSTAQQLIDEGINPDSIESAADLAKDPEKRIKFQADVQDYVDMSISSTINMPAWGSPDNNEDTVMDMAKVLAKYAPRLRGFTCYPDGCRGGQPITPVEYELAKKKRGVEYAEHDVCDITGKGGTCGS